MLRSSSTVISRAVLGAVTASRIFSEPIANPFRRSERHLVGSDIPNRIFGNNFSTVPSDDAPRNVDRKLKKALKHEIKSFDESAVEMPEPPSGFPFEIEDVPESMTVKLKREFEGEKIEVEVFNPIYPRSDTDDDDDEKIPAKTSCGAPNEARIQLNVSITKEDGEKLEIMLWGVVGYVGHPIMFHVNGIRFSDEKLLGFDWVEIIRARGVDDSMAEFMMEYMDRRFDRNLWHTLKNFRVFVKE